jgi:hypothetical protein
MTSLIINPNEDIVIGFVLDSNGSIYKPLQILKEEEETYDDNNEEERIARFIIICTYTFLSFVLPLLLLRFF